MSAYTYIKAIGTALAASTAIRDYCIDLAGRGCLVRIDDYPADPLSSDHAPFILATKTPTQEQGPVADEQVFQIDLVAGVAMTDDAMVPAATTARTATANGLEQVGDAEIAEDLIELALGVIRGMTLTGGAYVHSVAEESDGWSMLPLQLASAQITVRRPRTLGEW
jgi:hypothetical protein